MSNTLDDFDDNPGFRRRPDGSQRSGLSSSVLVTAVLCLVFVVVLICILNLYARFLLRRQHAQRLRAQRPAPFHRAVTHGGSLVVDTHLERPKTGLDPSVVASLPRFAYKKTEPAGDTDAAVPDDCSVCLSQLEEGEMVRHLPACGHTFHDKCIDMWLYSHNTCPVCRREVGPVSNNTPPAGSAAVEVVVVVQVGGDSSHPRVVAQATQTQLLMPPSAAGCGGDRQGQHSGRHEEDDVAPSPLASFRHMFSLERSGARRQQQAGDLEMQ